MSLFQNSVLNKYLRGLETEKVKEAYEKFTKHFHNPEIQENIRNSKEEQYQGEFLIDLFVNILGYIKNPTPEFNLTTELKNIVNSKKADGAILTRGHAPLQNTPPSVIAVIELKGTNTTDLSKVETQAFGYKNNQPGCNYVITSNYEKLRFYIDNAVDFEEFTLFKLTKERFDILWLCLSSDYLLKNTPKKIKDESLTQEENITKKLYNDYSAFRNEIFDSIQKENPEYDKLTLFKKTQKLLDRFLFIFFAEDRLLLPPNSIRSIVNQWNDLRDKYDEYFPLYDRFKKYFTYMNTGHKGQQHDIFAYNGGLFAPDEILDNIKINDDILSKHTVILSNYNFESDVSVNILGHIFEHSLAATEHVPLSIRKRDGVFYTPKYITKYIVENTIGKLCEEKKIELDIQEAEYEKERKGRQIATLKKLTQKLDDYRKWLLQITICDPACGSGAFLNQALEFLIAEHRYIDELQAKLLGASLILSEVENSILENNLYGVDINEESVEIAKLSLWLRTAQKGRKLTTLNNNIKCGNSLIDDPNVAGEKAFNWQNEFPNIFRKKEKQAWHITTATHNSRYSQRMFDCHIELGKAEWIDEKDEIVISETIRDIVIEDKLNVLEYNICGDHVHLLLVCEKEEVAGIVGKLKSVSAKNRNRERGYTTTAAAGGTTAATSKSTGAAAGEATGATTGAATRGHAPLSGTVPESVRGNTQRPLWTQKFGKKLVAAAPTRGHAPLSSNDYLANAINYIRNNRIKHGLPENSEIEKIKKEFLCTRQHAFRTEYAGGFDVVIGNPPYVHLEKIKETSIALKNAKYETYHSQGDIYCVFVEKGIDLLKPKGLISYIMPNKWLQAGYGKPLREYFLKYRMFELIDFGDIQIFDGATTYPCIFTSQKAEPQKEISISVLKESNSIDFKFNVLETAEKFQTNSFSGETWVISSQKEQAFLEKLKTKFVSLSDFIGGQSYRGVLTGLTEAFLIDENTKQTIVKEDSNAEEIIKPFLQGRDLTKYNYSKQLFNPF